MKATRIACTLMMVLAGSVALSGCKRDEQAAVPATPPAPMTEPAPTLGPAPPVESQPAAVSVSAITVGNTAAADRSVAAMSTLDAKDKIIVSVRTDGAATNTTVGAKLTHQDGQVAAEESQALNTGGSETTNIEFSNANAWPAGRYTIDVTLDGNPAGMSQQIEVK